MGVFTCRQIIFETTEGAKEALRILGSKEFIQLGIYAALASPRKEAPVQHSAYEKPNMDVRFVWAVDYVDFLLNQ